MVLRRGKDRGGAFSQAGSVGRPNPHDVQEMSHRRSKAAAQAEGKGWEGEGVQDRRTCLQSAPWTSRRLGPSIIRTGHKRVQGASASAVSD